jgi:hypothetical protein
MWVVILLCFEWETKASEPQIIWTHQASEVMLLRDWWRSNYLHESVSIHCTIWSGTVALSHGCKACMLGWVPLQFQTCAESTPQPRHRWISPQSPQFESRNPSLRRTNVGKLLQRESHMTQAVRFIEDARHLKKRKRRSLSRFLCQNFKTLAC